MKRQPFGSRPSVEAIGFPDYSSGRNLRIDALKAIAIVLVVLGHSLEIADPGVFVPNPSFRHHLAILIYTFHMPLFMFLAGYVMSGRKVKVGKSFTRLIVPFFTWMLVKFLIFVPAAKYGELGHYVRYGVWSMENAPLWFLWVLFFCYLLLIPCRYAGRFGKYGEESALLGMFLLINLIPSTRLGIPHLQYYFIFFILGYLSAKHKEAILRLKPRLKITVLTLSPVVFLAVFFASYDNLNNIVSAMPLRELLKAPDTFLVRFCLAVLGILSAYAVLSAIETIKAGKLESAVAWLGLATLDIYVAHGILIHLSFGSNWVKVASAFLIGLAGSLALTYTLLRNWRIFSIPFLGKDYRYGPRYRLQVSPEAGPVEYQSEGELFPKSRNVDTAVEE
ncbi:MAG: acyltransferase family protein [Actinobacteria bacterium]|nr:acyltransferase family protein [Actinomycetota bacterium]